MHPAAARESNVTSGGRRVAADYRRERALETRLRLFDGNRRQELMKCAVFRRRRSGKLVEQAIRVDDKRFTTGHGRAHAQQKDEIRIAIAVREAVRVTV